MEDLCHSAFQTDENKQTVKKKKNPDSLCKTREYLSRVNKKITSVIKTRRVELTNFIDIFSITDPES